VCDIFVKKFTFAISSPDEFLFIQHTNKKYTTEINVKFSVMPPSPEFIRRNCFFRQCTVQDMVRIRKNVVKKFVVSAVY